MTTPVDAPFDRLVAKETALGAIREIPIPTEHIGLSEIAPWKEVDSDDVIFDFLEDGLTDGLAPARAQDAESELAQKDDYAISGGRARVIDWTLKSNYDQGKVMNYDEARRIQQALQGINSVNLRNGQGFLAPALDFGRKVARDDAWRVSRLYNRLEQLIMSGFFESGIDYDDGKIHFAVDFKRPADQQDVPVDVWWDALTADPIQNIKDMNRFMYQRYGVKMKRAWCSERDLEKFFQIDKFVALTGMQNFTNSTTPVDLSYLRPNWGNEAAIQIIEQATGVKFRIYDGTYRVRPLGTNARPTLVRYTDSRKVVFAPSEEDLAQIDPDGIGFARTLTSPHPEGNWQPGFYEWEKVRSDPWTVDRGNGVKAFPIFPFLKYTYVMQVLENSDPLWRP